MSEINVHIYRVINRLWITVKRIQMHFKEGTRELRDF